eukprot:CAMPEP_0116071930 /NCGR_PEP_ID=MMETSP0322-20121206/14135_1 /TAXON_ID=163516 /ORGANISM="Leptocylindrus danicus var. apora, Strain B651" /LENGTH=973 /DNA_ID=CAMNT_0003560497 /DNA_START=352 /DNA_END=3269 /DNA_ORIENTATION=+
MNLRGVPHSRNSANFQFYRLATTQATSFTEPNSTLLRPPQPLDENAAAPEVDAYLRADVKAMGSMLGRIISTTTTSTTSNTFDSVERLRLLAKEWRENGKDDGTFAQMAEYAASLSNEEIQSVARAFTHFLALANTAEAHHRTRKNRTYMASKSLEEVPLALMDKRDSCGGVIPELLQRGGENAVRPSDVYESLCSQQVELVLTAHPTEVNKRTILQKKKTVLELLSKADEIRAGGRDKSYEASLLLQDLECQISSLWQSDEVARAKPSPQEEARRGMLVLESVLWEALPEFLEKLSYTMQRELGGEEYALPLTACPIKFSSWMGGDRDGNPNVTPDVTREVVWRNRVQSAELIIKEVHALIDELTVLNCTDAFRAVVGNSDEAREPYRYFLRQIRHKLEHTRKWADSYLDDSEPTISATQDDVYMNKQQLLDDLIMVYDSLVETNNGNMTKGRLTHLIRNVASFGVTLCALDVRQESTRHTEALDAITRHLGIGSYAEWDETTRISWLSQEMTSKRPLLRYGDWNDASELFSSTVVDTLETFAMIAECQEESLGAYVISQATTPSDVMAVSLLQRNAGVSQPLRVVPLFETLDDLNGATKTMETLYSTAAYVGSLVNRKQEIMIGYSDSAKDAGRLAASWAQYETQEALAAQAKKYQIDLTFFHGKGGTVGRGGNPSTFNAILSHAPDTINGNFRVTEQGEMIYQNFGHKERAERTLDIYTAAVLAEKQLERPAPTENQRALMNKLSQISCDAYRQIVRGDDRFVPYFRSATPELELSSLNIGSRPAKRKASGGVESLRAIPWIFAWTQTRLNLPTWLGVGQAIDELLSSEEYAEDLRKMYKEWDSFRTTIDLVEMVLAKSEPDVAKHYEDVLVSDPLAKELGSEIRNVHLNTERAVLELAGHETLGENNELLARVLKVRNPYVDCLNVLQAETLKRLRSVPDDEGTSERKKLLNDALLTTITGIANGMGNT